MDDIDNLGKNFAMKMETIFYDIENNSHKIKYQLSSSFQSIKVKRTDDGSLDSISMDIQLEIKTA